MSDEPVEKSYEERKTCIRELRKLMEEDDLLKNLESSDEYLERFLYCTDFDVEAALKRLKMFYELLKECPNWFSQGCPADKKSIIDKNIRIAPREYDKEGRSIYIAKIANMDYGTMNLVEDVVPVDDFFAETLLSESAPSKHGICVLIDVASFSWKLMRWLNPFTIKMILRRVMSMPVKEYRFHVINNCFLVSTAIKIIWPLLPKFIKDMVFFHFNDYDSLYKHVDKDVLPVEYGGKKDLDYSEYNLWVYNENSHIAESFAINRTRFLQKLEKNEKEDKIG